MEAQLLGMLVMQSSQVFYVFTSFLDFIDVVLPSVIDYSATTEERHADLQAFIKVFKIESRRSVFNLTS